MVCRPEDLGGVYIPEVSIVPTAALPPGMPSTAQLTSLLGTPLTAAANLTTWFGVTDPARGLTVTVLTGTLPTPARATVCKVAGSVSLIVIRPFLVPEPLGVKTTLNWHVLPAANELPQLLDSW